MLTKPYLSISIIDCGEPLVAIPAEFPRVAPHPYAVLGAPYGDRSPYWLRQGVLQRLQRAQFYLRERSAEWELCLFDAYRPVAVQRFMVERSLADLARERGLEPQRLSESEREGLMAEVLQFWALPSDDPADPPPHSTGAAIDLTLRDAAGRHADMGSPIDDMSSRSHPDYYADSTTEPERTYHAHRLLLRGTMQAAGFHQHPNEWWHFSYGDRLWAWQERQLGREAIAIYGRAE